MTENQNIDKPPTDPNTASSSSGNAFDDVSNKPVDEPIKSSKEPESEHVLRYSTGLIDHTAGYSGEEPGEFYFESDHPALKGNDDYQKLLRALVQRVILRTKLIQDINRIEEVRKQAMVDPIKFVEKLQKGEDIGFPPLRHIPSLPEIDWGKYNIKPDPKALGRHHHFTRKRTTQAEIVPGNNGNTRSSTDSDSARPTLHPILIRGRIYNDSKPPTFNQLWSIEEQKKLEDLLLQYPPEDIEARRWQKIAKALGTRTPQQVASRVQKYFAKLSKAGLPVPGRVPTIPHFGRTSHHHHHHQRHNRFYYQQSTFLTSFEPPVYLSDDEDHNSTFSSGTLEMDPRIIPDDDVSDEDEFASLKDSDEYKQLLLLKKMKKAKERQNSVGVAQHIGYKCERCQCEPIIGIRWHCMECPPDNFVDFCEDCVDCMHETQTHLPSHRLKPIYQSQTPNCIDGDYTRFLHTDYNYLDPNYLPAV